jgi:hypothetical protein
MNPQVKKLLAFGGLGLLSLFVLIFCLTGFAKGDEDLTVAQQELKATIDAAQAKRIAELNKLLIEKQAIQKLMDAFNAKVDAVQNEWQSTVNAALKAYKARESEKQEYGGPVRGALFHTIGLNDAQEEIARANQDTIKENDRWREWSQKGATDHAKDIAKAPPYEHGKIVAEWHDKYNKEWFEHNKKLQEINKRLQERLQQRR